MAKITYQIKLILFALRLLLDVLVLGTRLPILLLVVLQNEDDRRKADRTLRHNRRPQSRIKILILGYLTATQARRGTIERVEAIGDGCLPSQTTRVRLRDTNAFQQVKGARVVVRALLETRHYA